ncbi:hypothetical protein PHYBLDRAFT_163090 [Phycomyces blakesleeanus NRRL 1555(-)]|uniref:Uncharacterized protein n=1 Tax=Phycomyces blakesleeanus (strain ATCC 8743b / DSM 1359 / FGSC 10004 / NBRC 33097 / NRRL 1555) TaxID=763407 RepID=A0A167QPW2_PHYB8|nr:hypothetical protein PHYBLDRAFT_163090 [Phycomyces blakesleeanus NRRL 1555(-)]OAD80038.1 hypothetical protein PHYBLDRAFT_163090 [Phycomyces blakesleeanus NRRL 1555(-)]|eukprot:XP_018298078.1 hypothetical protein PHYBLDRAFT_163090 [Phycomyces blakesleeanus NRRL 1555(-)]
MTDIYFFTRAYLYLAYENINVCTFHLEKTLLSLHLPATQLSSCNFLQGLTASQDYILFMFAYSLSRQPILIPVMADIETHALCGRVFFCSQGEIVLFWCCCCVTVSPEEAKERTVVKYSAIPAPLLSDRGISISLRQAWIMIQFISLVPIIRKFSLLKWHVRVHKFWAHSSSINRWYSFLCDEIAEKRLKSTIFVINKHMLVHLGYIMREKGPLRVYSCRPIECLISAYRATRGSRKETRKNMDNILFCKAGIRHCLSGRSAVVRPTDRRTGSFEVASDDVVGPELLSSPTRMFLGAVEKEMCMNYGNLVRDTDELVGVSNKSYIFKSYGFIRKFFFHSVLGETSLFFIDEHLCGAWASNEGMFPVWERLTLSEMKVVEVKSIKGMTGLIDDINNENISHVVFPHPRHYE